MLIVSGLSEIVYDSVNDHPGDRGDRDWKKIWKIETGKQKHANSKTKGANWTSIDAIRSQRAISMLLTPSGHSPSQFVI